MWPQGRAWPTNTISLLSSNEWMRCFHFLSPILVLLETGGKKGGCGPLEDEFIAFTVWFSLIVSLDRLASLSVGGKYIVLYRVTVRNERETRSGWLARAKARFALAIFIISLRWTPRTGCLERRCAYRFLRLFSSISYTLVHA